MHNEDFKYHYKAILTGVYDGDSCTVSLDLGCFTWRHSQKIRLMNINAPEIRGHERPLGLEARDALRELLPIGTELILNTYLDRDDKYGRLLAVIYKDGLNVNDWLVSNGYAVPFMEKL